MKNKTNLKKKQHYVSRFYLKAWANSKEQIYCLRNEKIFETNLMNVVQERYFYELQDLSKEKIDFVKGFIAVHDSKMLKELNFDWLNKYLFTFQIENEFKDKIENNLIFQQELNSFRKTFEEEKHTAIESRGYKYLGLMKSNEIDFFYHSMDRASFLYFICTQYFRTKKIREGLINNFDKIGKNMRRIAPLLVDILAKNLSFNLYLDKKFKLILLENNTDIEFIAGDQPVINTFAIIKKELQDEELEFYYPITPKLAILLSDRGIFNERTIITDKNEIDKYNRYIINSSYESIFSTNKENLTMYKTIQTEYKYR